MHARSPAVVTAFALLIAPSVVAAQTSRHVLTGDSVAVYNLVGELRVDPGTGSDVVVEVQRGGADAAKLDIQSGPLRGRQTLRIIYPDDVISMPDWGHGWNTTLHVRDDGTFGDSEGHHHGFSEGHEVRITSRGRGGLEAYADLHVSIPAGKSVGLYLGVGKTTITNVNGSLRVSVASADVAASGTKGALRISTGSGNVDVRTVAGEINLETGSGDITVSGMQGTSLKLNTGSGDVTLTDGKADDVQVETGSGTIDAKSTSGDELSFDTGSGDVDVALSAGFRSLHIETGSGNVTVKVPPELGAQVDLDTGSGDIDLGGLTLQVRRIEHDHVTGTLGDGKGRLSVETGSGNVRLERF